MNFQAIIRPALSHRALGLSGMLASAVMFSLMSCLVRLAPEIGSYRTSMVRFAVGIALLGTLAMCGKVSLTFHNRSLLLWRGLFGGFGVVMHYYAIIHLGLAKGTVITYLYPMFAAIFGSIVLRERVGLGKGLAIALAFVGLVLTITSESMDFSTFGVPECIAIAGAVLAGIVVVMIRKLRESDSASSIFCAQCAVGFWIVIIPANQAASVLPLNTALILVAIGLLAACGQLLMTYSFKHVTVTSGSLLSMLCPVLNVLFGVLLFGESMTWVNGLGMAIVLCACGWMAARK
jgi:drug/metabolite transporter (DMT)-like permease